MKTGNIFDTGTLNAGDGERFEPVVQTEDLLIERIISTGQATPEGEWYDQPRDEWVVLLTGHAVLGFEDGQTLALKPGDHLLIPARCRHRVEFTTADPPCIWLAVHSELTGKEPIIP